MHGSRCCGAWIPGALLIIVIAGCMHHEKASPELLLQTDRDFSALSGKKGSVYAFHAYMADSGRVLPRSAEPMGRDIFAQMLSESGDHESRLTWEPLYADIAASGDLGYTHGRYLQIETGTDGKATETRGFYVTIWKRQPDGSWKFVFDTGNQLP